MTPRYCPLCHHLESRGLFGDLGTREWIQIEGCWYHLDCAEDKL